MTDREKNVIKGLEKLWDAFNYIEHELYADYVFDALELLKEQQAEIDRLKAEKENVIKEIEERKAFNLKCDGQPEWLRKGIDVGLNTVLDILKGKDGEQE